MGFKIQTTGKTLVLIDWANMWKSGLDIELLYKYLKTNVNIDKITLYFGLDSDERKSSKFLSKAKMIGYEVKQKIVKKIPKKMCNSEFKHIHKNVIEKLKLLDNQLENENHYIENSQIINEINNLLESVVYDRKADFDVEITMDILLNIDEYDSFILLSGDGDYKAPINYLLIKNKKTIIIHSKDSLGKEIIKLGELFPELSIFEVGYINRKLGPQNGIIKDQNNKISS